jgi:hypothetical protein
MMLFGGNHRRGTTTRTPQTRTTVVHNIKGDFLVSETTGGLPTAKKKMHHHHHRSDEEATARRRSSPPSTTTTTTNAERLWELQRELAKELIFSENDTASKEKRGAPRERRKGRTRKEEEEEKNSKIIRNDEQREDESASSSSSSSSSSPANFHHEERIFDRRRRRRRCVRTRQRGETDEGERPSKPTATATLSNRRPVRRQRTRRNDVTMER